MRARNLFESEHEREISNPDYAWFANLYANQIKTVDSIINTLDIALERSNLTKAELARKLDIEASNIRRVFMGSNNPTIHTIADLAFVLDYELVLVPKTKKSSSSQKIHRTSLSTSRSEGAHI